MVAVGAQAGSTQAIVGRDELIEAAIGSAERGTGTVFHGDPGVGRSRLAQEIVHRLEGRGWPAAFLRCGATGSETPLGVFAPFLSDAIPHSGLSMVVAARDSILRRTDGSPLILGLDDIHLIDVASAVLTSQLVAEGAVVLIATHRNMAVVLEPVAMLWHDDFCRHVHVPNLDRADADALAAGLSGRPVGTDELGRLWARTQGNPFFLAAILEHFIAATAQAEDTLERLILDQLADLPTSLHDALVVAAFAEPIEATILEELTDIDALIQLERRSLITIDRNGRRADVRVRHALYGEHVRATTPEPIAHAIRSQLIDAVIGLGARRQDDLLRLATWSVEIDRPLELEIGLRVAESVVAHGDPDVGRQIAEGLWTRTQSQRAASLVASGLVERGDGQAAIDWVERALPAADSDLESALLDLAARAALFKLGDVPRAHAFLDRAGDQSLTAATRVLVHAASGWPERALAIDRSARSSHAEGPAISLSISLSLSVALAMSGDSTSAIDLIEGMLSRVVRTNPHPEQVALLIEPLLVQPLFAAGRITEAEEIGRAACTTEATSSMTSAAARRVTALAAILPWTGHPAESVHIARHAARSFTRNGDLPMASWAWRTMGLAAVAARSSSDAHEALDAMADLDMPSMFGAERALLIGSVASLDHDVDTARAAWTAHAAWSRERALVVEETWALYALALLDGSASSRLAELGRRFGGMIELLADHAAAMVSDDADLLGSVAERCRASGLPGLAAEGFSRAVDLLLATGRVADARRMRGPWQEAADRCDAPMSLAPAPIAATVAVGDPPPSP